METASILIVDDDEMICSALSQVFQEEGFQVDVFHHGKEALEALGSSGSPADIAFVDLRIPDIGGIEMIRLMREIHPAIIPIVITGSGSIDSAVEATKAGAYHYMTKPFNQDEVRSIVEKALSERRSGGDRIELPGFDGIVGESTQMKQVFSLIERVAKSDSTVLILGDSGTGKELVARAIHRNSTRRKKPLIPMNCGSIPETLLESELFGHVKGAFTGASASRLGRFSLADKGIIFLDEIGDMSPALQVKLLRVLQEQEFEQVGGTRTIKVDVWVVAATNQDLHKSVQEAKFREDLYYRLNVIRIAIPPLRERKSDISLLVEHFIRKFNREKGRKLGPFTDSAMERLESYHWPGNVREMENLIERLVILKGEGEVTVENLDDLFYQSELPEASQSVVLPKDGIDFKTAVTNFENDLILQALNRSNWNKNRAADLLQLNRTTLVEKIKRKKLEPTTDDL